MQVSIEELTVARWDAVAALFRASDCPCFCRFWHFEGDKNAWLERCASSAETNATEQRGLLASGDAGARGLVAMSGDDAVGWMKLAPRASLPKLRTRPVYRSADLGEDDGVLSIGCFLVRPDMRHHGVARALLAAAPGIAERWGARALEAYPHRASSPLGDHEVWMGPMDLFTEAGFEIVATASEGPYPVLRRTLNTSR